MNLLPNEDRVLVRPIEEKRNDEGRIIIPETAKDKPTRGEIVAVGPGRLVEGIGRVPLDWREGDVVLFGKYSGQKIEVDGDELLFIRAPEILATERSDAL